VPLTASCSNHPRFACRSSNDKFGYARATAHRCGVETDPHLANRFEPAVLHRWTMGEDYLRLLASFELALPLEHRSGFLEPAMASKF
jgi:hypothetical protein